MNDEEHFANTMNRLTLCPESVVEPENWQKTRKFYSSTKSDQIDIV